MIATILLYSTIQFHLLIRHTKKNGQTVSRTKRKPTSDCFTHRLSLLGQLIELTDGKITTECIRKEHWGTGEIGETPLFAKRPDKALKNIAQEKLTKVQKYMNNKDKVNTILMGNDM